MTAKAEASSGQRTRTVLVTLAAGQFLMTLDSSVMNVSIATVAKDVGTTVTGIQAAITLYTLVMAMLMITGGKIGSMIGRRRAFMIGCLIYGAGSLGALGTALAGSILIAVLTGTFLQGIENNPAIPQNVSSQASVPLASGVPFTSDADLQAALAKAGTPPDVAQAALEVNKEARLAGLRAAVAMFALIALLALFFTRPIPARPVGQSAAQQGDAAATAAPDGTPP